ncbi:hydroxymethylpyrimidine ABC transporter [Gracilibacillus boraciitolerans JCM 21714]|uniref:Hydroxymethylpyrimidine ABC transporter n=1 Tax=Gracilibacillus boraciitolerans JCM 21714 TaxID=1298598 RepID=W4VPC4_9BACI|nr:ABC transporter permease [Gracilibacillus boraciitolerans]GAE95011.1 hydroxymethylpyrimidine ABC transporter [Gracilibacillus boraciitolerans JCM 21714]
MFRKSYSAIIVIVSILIIWEIASRLLHIPTWILPAPTVILQEAFTNWHHYNHHIISTIFLTISGFAIGVTVGLLIAILLHLLPRVREALYPLLILSQNIPIIVLAPLLVIWFGFGVTPKLLIITLVCFFPIAVATIDGLKQTNPELIHYMKMAGATKKQIFTKLELPHAIPQLFSGLKISATYSVMGAVISEWLGANQGIGVYMTLASSSFRTDRVFVAILFIMMLCLIFFAIIITAERLILKWRPSEESNR